MIFFLFNKIYCENFDAAINEKLKKLTNSGGATRYDEYSSDVTHIIANQINEKKCKNYVDMNPEYVEYKEFNSDKHDGLFLYLFEFKSQYFVN